MYTLSPRRCLQSRFPEQFFFFFWSVCFVFARETSVLLIAGRIPCYYILDACTFIYIYTYILCMRSLFFGFYFSLLHFFFSFSLLPSRLSARGIVHIINIQVYTRGIYYIIQLLYSRIESPHTLHTGKFVHVPYSFVRP